MAALQVRVVHAARLDQDGGGYPGGACTVQEGIQVRQGSKAKQGPCKMMRGERARISEKNVYPFN